MAVITRIFVQPLGMPWMLLYLEWHRPDRGDHPDDFIPVVIFGGGMFGGAANVIPFFVLWYLFSFPVALIILVVVSALLFWYLRTARTAIRTAMLAIERDTEKKQGFIGTFGKLAPPLARLLTRYHPDWYPPPVNRILTALIAQYATVLRDLDKANGNPHRDMPDEELLRSSSTLRFPESWDYERTDDFCCPIFDIAETLRLCAELPLEMQAKYEAELMHIFDQDQLPPELQAAINPILEKHNFAQPESEIAYTEARLTALIPEYIAQTHTVIGTPPNGLPVPYDSLESRYRHTFLIGRSGAGKSTVITNFVAQDMHRGYGVIVMSPDEDLMRRIVPYIPEHRLDDVIYFDPTDTTFPMIGFNPFYFEPPDNPRDYQLLKHRKAGETYTILERTLGLSTQEGMQTLLNNAMHALIGRPTATINELRRLLDPKERALHRQVANDPDVDDYTREYWESYATEGANALVYRNLTRRMANLLRPPLFDIFSTHSLSFHREINERARIILLDLSNFPRDSMEAKITAQLMIATVQQTILRRDKIRKEDYIPYFMYIDEFQNFADTNEKSIGDMAEQLRKYSFGLTLTSLVASDLSGRLFDTIIGVMSTFICLSMSAKDARRFADEMSLKHSGTGEFSYESLQKLKIGQAFVKTPPLDTAVFVQMPREPIGNLPKGTITLQHLKNRSKANFGATARPQESSAVDSDTQPEHGEEPPHTTPAPEPLPQREPPKKQTPRPTTRRRRNRFDDDAGSPEIEVR